MDTNKIQNLKNQAISNILEAKTEEELENLRISLLGRKGELTAILKQIPSLPADKRVEIGKITNEAKRAIEEAIQSQISRLQTQVSTLEKEWLDVTAPGKKPPQGHLHLITYAIREIIAIFEKIGFTRLRYPEVEWDWYAFEGLNMPENHPARDEFETFYITDKMLLTPHTSSGQLREMERRKPPIRMINIGKCYRPNWDPSHIPMFYQFEGLVIDQDITLVHLKGTLDYFIHQFFGPERQSRIRPFHFRFTEPSIEVDVSCDICKSKGCRVCKNGWLELGGAGMVHPIVLKNGGIDPERYTGFAFGWGVERVLMMKTGLKLDDIRTLYQNDLRFLNQF